MGRLLLPTVTGRLPLGGSSVLLSHLSRSQSEGWPANGSGLLYPMCCPHTQPLPPRTHPCPQDPSLQDSPLPLRSLARPASPPNTPSAEREHPPATAGHHRGVQRACLLLCPSLTSGHLPCQEGLPASLCLCAPPLQAAGAPQEPAPQARLFPPSAQGWGFQGALSQASLSPPSALPPPLCCPLGRLPPPLGWV